MRAVDCPCGEHVESDSDMKLIEDLKAHADQEHPGRYEEPDLRLLVSTSAYDAAA